MTLEHRREVSQEVANRIRVAVAAWAYENSDDNIKPIMSDAAFDALALQIRPDFETNSAVMDKFFREEFNPDTGQWVHKHPDIVGLSELYYKVWHEQRG